MWRNWRQALTFGAIALAVCSAIAVNAGAATPKESPRDTSRERCDGIYDQPPPAIASAVETILEAEHALSDEGSTEYDFKAVSRADRRITRWTSNHCLVCTTASTARPGATAVNDVCPIGPDGRLLDSFSVVATRKHGSCNGSPSARVSSGLRCNGGDFIYDPCWPETGGPRPAVICMGNAWDQRVSRLLTKSREPIVRLPPSPGIPWGVELESGERCSLYGSGAHSSVEGSQREEDVMDYYCGSNDTGRVLLRGFDQTGPMWRARGYDWRMRERLPDQAIVRAWF